MAPLIKSTFFICLPSLVRPLPVPTADRWQIIREAREGGGWGTRWGGACVQDSLSASLLFLPRVCAARVCHGPAQAILRIECSLVSSSSASWLVLHPHHPHPHHPYHPPLSSQPAGGEAVLLQITQIQTRYICSASALIGHGALKKDCFSFCACFLTVRPRLRAMNVCVRVCRVTPKAARAPFKFQMTLFTDTTQPPRIPRQNLISRECQDLGAGAEREIQVTNYSTFFNYVEILLRQGCNGAGN